MGKREYQNKWYFKEHSLEANGLVFGHFRQIGFGFKTPSNAFKKISSKSKKPTNENPTLKNLSLLPCYTQKNSIKPIYFTGLFFHNLNSCKSFGCFWFSFAHKICMFHFKILNCMWYCCLAVSFDF